MPARGSTLCRIAARQMSTTSNFKSCASRPSRTNLSIAQKQMAPTTIIITQLFRCKPPPPLTKLSAIKATLHPKILRATNLLLALGPGFRSTGSNVIRIPDRTSGDTERRRVAPLVGSKTDHWGWLPIAYAATNGTGEWHVRHSVLVLVYWLSRVDLDRVRRDFNAHNRSPRSVGNEARRAFEVTLNFVANWPIIFAYCDR